MEEKTCYFYNEYIQALYPSGGIACDGSKEYTVVYCIDGQAPIVLSVPEKTANLMLAAVLKDLAGADEKARKAKQLQNASALEKAVHEIVDQAISAPAQSS